MERLWAPWRIEFIKELREKGEGCVFCNLHKDKSGDRKNLVLHRGKHSYILMNRYPYNNGHLLVLPYDHVDRLSGLSSETHTEIMKLASASVDILASTFEAEGFNCGFNIGKAGGAGIVDHIHLHVVPRWVGDSNFLPIIGNTRSMPEYLSDTYDKLAGEFEKIEA